MKLEGKVFTNIGKSWLEGLKKGQETLDAMVVFTSW